MKYDQNGRVIIDISEQDFNLLLMCLGAATATLGTGMLGLANRINEGNPNWSQYKLDK